MKKISAFLFFMFSISLANVYNPQEQTFKTGFEAGIKALEFQRENDGVQPKKIILRKSFYLIYEIDKVPLNEALFLQNIASREGYHTHLTRDFIFFGEFDREADAREIIKQLSNKFKIKVKLMKNTANNYIVTYPSLWNEFYTIFLEEARKNGYVIKVEVIKSPVKKSTTKISNVKKTVPKLKKMTLRKAKAMAYSLSGDEKDSKNYKEIGLQSGLFETSGNIITTKENEKFVKVANKNMYFSLDDVFIGE